MNQQQLIDNIRRTFNECLEIVRTKNSDYSKSNSDVFSNFRYAEYCNVPVEKAILVRISDKFARLNNVIDKGEVVVKDEVVADTIKDMMNYLAILGVYLEDKNKKHKQSGD